MKIFISYSRDDYKCAKRIYEGLLSHEELNPWIDQENLLPGMDWEEEILTAIYESNFIILVLSKKAVEKTGFVQTETKKALERFSRFPPGKLFIIPVRIDDCQPKYRELKKLHYIDLFPEHEWDKGFSKVIESIKSLTETKKAAPTIPIAKYSDVLITIEGVSRQCVPVFNNGRTLHIAYQKCNNATQFVSLNKKKWCINWKWENKANTWCGWGTDSLPNKNLAEYLNGYLYVIFTGIFDKQPPEAKFIDFDQQHTSLVNFSSFMVKSDDQSASIVKIPMNMFFGSDPDYYPADPTNIKFLQFDAEYSSIKGQISISYIGLSTK